jgi:hypothetical protein
MEKGLWSGTELAKEADIRYDQFNKRLNNGTSWTRSFVRRIAGALKCDVDDLVDDGSELPPWSYEANPKPVCLGDTVVDEVFLLVGNHVEPLEISPRYTYEFPVVPSDISAIADELAARAASAAAEKGTPYFNGPAVRLISANESENYQAADGREVKRLVLELGPLPWHTHMLLNGFLDDPTVQLGVERLTIRERYGDPENVYNNGPDLSWCRLSNIFTILTTPVTTDGYGLVQLRSKTGVAFAPGLFISGVSENMHRYWDESIPGDPIMRRNSLRGDGRRRVDHLYRPEGVPSPLLTAMRGVYEEVSSVVGEQLQATPNRFVFLNLIFGLTHFHPFLVGVVELPFTRAEMERLMRESPGKDHGEGTPCFFKLCRGDPDTAKMVAEKARWYPPGLAAFITSVQYWEKREADARERGLNGA